MTSAADRQPNNHPSQESDADADGSLFRYRFANAEYDEAQGLLRVAGQVVAVERLPLQLLALLLQRPGEIIERSALFATLWQDRATVDHVLANAVSKLRRSLGKEAGGRLVNVPRKGYRLDGPVERMAIGRLQTHTLELSKGKPVPGCDGYVLIGPAGNGAAGTTWRARDARLLETRVFKFARTGEELAALKREFTVSRLLLKELGQRSDIVALKASNFQHAPFFLAYEDAGEDLRAWAECGRLAPMSAQERIGLFLHIARAVSAAHSAEVLHRDLKPANILIAEDSGNSSRQVRLADFGSSQLLMPERLAELDVTALGMTVKDLHHPLLGSTPSYRAPELLMGHESTKQSDLYALGLILFQLLVGDLRRPLATGWEDEIADPLLVDDIRLATEGRSERRLAGVGMLIERLESLDQRRARRAEEAEATRKAQEATERRRAIQRLRPWAVTMAACFALGGIGVAWSMFAAHAARTQADLSAARSSAVHDFLNEDVLASMAVAEPPGGGAASSFDLLARASDRAGERFKDDPQTLAHVRRRLGDAYLRMRFADQAEYQYRRAITVLEPWVRPDNEEFLIAQFGLAEALSERGRPEQALTALEVAERDATGAGHSVSVVLRQRSLQSRTRVLIGAQRYREAEDSAKQLVLASDQPKEDGSIDTSLQRLAREWMCEVYMTLGETSRADRVLEELAAPPFNFTDARQSIKARSDLALARRELEMSRFSNAERRLLPLRDMLTHSEVKDPLHLGLVEQTLAEVYRRTGRFKEALSVGQEARQTLATALGERHELVTLAQLNVAMTKLDLGQMSDALRELEAIRPRLLTDGTRHSELLELDHARSRALIALGRTAQAREVSAGLDRTPLTANR